VDSIPDQLPPIISDLIFLRTFHMERSEDTLHKILDEILYKDTCSVTFGPPLLNFQRQDVFLFGDLSIASFTKCLQLALNLHFRDQPFSYLCNRDADIQNNISSKDMRHMLVKLPSLSIWRANNTNCKLADFKSQVGKWRKAWRKWRRKFAQLFDTFYDFIKAQTTLTQAELYGEMIAKDIESIKPLMDVFSKSSQFVRPGRSPAILRKFADHMGESAVNKLVEQSLKRIEKHLAAAKREEEKRKNEIAAPKTARKLTQMEKLQQGSQRKTAGRSKMQERRLMLGGGLQKGKVYENNNVKLAKKEVVNFFVSFMRRFFPPMNTLELHEILSSTEQGYIKEMLDGHRRRNVWKQLAEPHLYSNHSRSSTSSDLLLPDQLEDLKSLFDTLNEGNRQLNLHDWCLSFMSGLKVGTDETEAKARFMDSVRLMAHVGYLKHHQRRNVDSARKMVWKEA